MKDLILYFEATEYGNILYGDCDELSIKAIMEVPDECSEDYGYVTLKNAIVDELKRIHYAHSIIAPYDKHESKLADDCRADDDVDVSLEMLNGTKLYRTIERIGDGDGFEGEIYIDKMQAIDECQSAWNIMTKHDQEKRSCFYVAEYDSIEEADEAYCDHTTVYDMLGNWADNLLNLSGLSRKAFCEKYNIPYHTYEKWQYGIRECPDYVRELLERAVKEDFK